MRATLNISLPESLRAWVEKQVQGGGYGTASEYVRQLLREERKRQLREQIDDQLLRALESGDPAAADKQFWQQRHQELARRLGEKKKNKA